MAHALDGVIVLELGHVLNGPYCGMLLAGLGADVIKIEAPGGESLRARASRGHESQTFLFFNSSKRGISLDLKKPEGRDLLLKLVQEADVVVENYAAGVMDRLKIGYGDLKSVNPRIILGSGTGYGAGPYEGYAAMDITVQAMSGLITATGFLDGPPTKAGASVSDILGGVHLVSGILAALYQRERTGVGQHVEVSMHDSTVPTLGGVLGGWVDSDGKNPARFGNRSPVTNVSFHNLYETSDGWIAIICMSARHWGGLCNVIGREDLGEDPELRVGGPPRNRRSDEIDEAISAYTSTRTRAEVFKCLQEAGVPAAPAASAQEVLHDPHLEHRGMIRTVEGPSGHARYAFGSPLHLSESEPVEPTWAPGLGEHTTEVLERLVGLDGDEIRRLRDLGVI